MCVFVHCHRRASLAFIHHLVPPPTYIPTVLATRRSIVILSSLPAHSSCRRGGEGSLPYRSMKSFHQFYNSRSVPVCNQVGSNQGGQETTLWMTHRLGLPIGYIHSITSVELLSAAGQAISLINQQCCSKSHQSKGVNRSMSFLIREQAWKEFEITIRLSSRLSYTFQHSKQEDITPYDYHQR